MTPDAALSEFLSALGDDRLILGHRLSEWCGHAPILEEDIALANIALDLIGQSVFFLKKAGEAEGKGRSEDALAFLREAGQYRNLTLVEQPNGDFAFTIARQFIFDSYSVPLLKILSGASHPDIAAIAAKSLKEDLYHLRHSTDWVLRLGDGTDESKARMQKALDALWPFTGELFLVPPSFHSLIERGKMPDLSPTKTAWEKTISEIFGAAKLSRPADSVAQKGGRFGAHSEHLKPLLAEMQTLQRAFPGAAW